MNALDCIIVFLDGYIIIKSHGIDQDTKKWQSEFKDHTWRLWDMIGKKSNYFYDLRNYLHMLEYLNIV